MEYIDLTVRISPGPGESFLASFSSSVGGGESTFALPANLAGAADVVAGGRSDVRGTGGSAERDIVGVGRKRAETAGSDARTVGIDLYRALFGAELQSAFDRAIGATRNDPGTGVRIRIAMDLRGPGMSTVASLPWELLEQAGTERPLAVSRRTPLVRSVDVPEPTEPLPFVPPLRILAIPSNPLGSGTLNLAEERKRIEASWALLPGVRVDFIRPVVSTILEHLADHEYHVVHYMGHGDFDEDSGKGVLVLENENGGPEYVDSERLRVIFGDESTLRLVFLNACDTGVVSGEHGMNPFFGVATGLLRSGVPAVLAMQAPIRDDAAVRFADTFYRRIARGEPIDAAVAEGRKELWDGTSVEWATPVLFLRSRDGALFRVADGATGESGASVGTEPAAATPPVPAAAGPRLFFAATSDSLRPLQRRLSRELASRGIEIPEAVPPPFERDGHDDAVLAAVRAADLTVHLLDERPGETIEDSTDGRTYPSAQLSIALESARSQLVLLPEQMDASRIGDPAYAGLIDSLMKRPRDADRLEVVHTTATRMLDEIAGKLRRLEEQHAQEPVAGGSVEAAFIDLHANDFAGASALIDHLASRHIAPLMMPTTDAAPSSALSLFEDNLRKVPLCIVVYGAVARDWVLNRLNAAVQVVTLNGLSTRICVYVAPPTKAPEMLRFPPFYEVAANMSRFEPATVDDIIRKAGEVPA